MDQENLSNSTPSTQQPPAVTAPVMEKPKRKINIYLVVYLLIVISAVIILVASLQTAS